MLGRVGVEQRAHQRQLRADGLRDGADAPDGVGAGALRHRRRKIREGDGRPDQRDLRLHLRGRQTRGA